ncbi:MAG TPA: amidohydrolase family protein [Candidatus Sulfotelmatobacter sp.]|nr:amidohydrolase family protein [Candidatus Sulfotelmatobacter sp.]
MIDAHHHLWDYEAAHYPWMTEAFASIRRRFGPEHLAPLLTECGVSHTVLVQSRSGLDETRALLAVAARTPFIAGVVGWADLTSDRVDRTLAALRAGAGGAKLVGIRHQVHDEADPAWLLRPDVQRGLVAVGEAGLAFDLLVRPRELPGAQQTVANHPRMRFVVDHLAKPPIRAGDSAAWDAWMPRLAALPNVSCKLSGLVTEADWHGWTVAQLAPYAERALSWFGPKRLLFGSDWPVCLVAAPYRDVVATAQALLPALSPGDRLDVFGRNAASVYGLKLA